MRKIRVLIFALFLILLYSGNVFAQKKGIKSSIFLGSGQHCGGRIGIGYEQMYNNQIAILGAIGVSGNYESTTTFDVAIRYYSSDLKYFFTAGYGVAAVESGGELGFEDNTIYGIPLTAGYRYFFNDNIYIGALLGLSLFIDETKTKAAEDFGGFLASGLFLGYGF